MALRPTPEQDAAREVFAAGADLALVAGAGTGKTSTLVMMGNSTRRRGLYMAFNRSIAEDARQRFGPNVACRTAHSLAFAAVGRTYKARLDASARIPARETARLLGIRHDISFGEGKRITVTHQARLVMDMLRRFCHSVDREVTARHAEQVNGLGYEGQEQLSQFLLRYAVRAWDDIRATGGRLRFEHDHYMKLWAMGDPVLPGEFVLLDEAQDTNPVLEEVFLNQDAQRICVGDPAQQIYAWRSARDVMTGFPAEHLHLTQSFRFGPAVADLANRWLVHADSALRLTGHGPASKVGTFRGLPDAVLCRGNADVMAEVLEFLGLGVPVALAGGGAALERIAHAAAELQAGRRTGHPELFLFTSWDEVREYTEHDTAGQDLKAIVGLVDTYGPDVIIEAVSRLSDESRAQVTVSTVHRAKGREWNTVRMGRGFEEPVADADGIHRELHPAEAKLIYVAVTRARHQLDADGVGWLDGYERSRTGRAKPLGALSLTGQLKYRASPVSQFMDLHLPKVTGIEYDYLARLAGLPPPVQPVTVARPDWSALGHTVDYRLRLSFGGSLGPAVQAGVELFTSPGLFGGALPEPVRKALHQAGRELLVEVAAAQPEERLVRLCHVASFYESVAREGRIRRQGLLGSATPATTLADLVKAVPSYVLDDVARQMSLAEAPLAHLRALPQHARICGPVFSGSTDLGGADADYILGGLLLDCKATTRPRSLGREEIYQLAGYLLLDYDDKHSINHVGLYLARQGALITWPVEEFLSRLAATAPLADLRTALRTHLRQTPHPRTHPPELHALLDTNLSPATFHRPD